MKVFIKRVKSNIDATGEFNTQNGHITVLEGSKLSERVASSEKFRGSKSIKRYREGIVVDGILKQNVEFNSASTAANFVTGNSTNGLKTWKTEEGIRLKDIISKEEK